MAGLYVAVGILAFAHNFSGLLALRHFFRGVRA